MRRIVQGFIGGCLVAAFALIGWMALAAPAEARALAVNPSTVAAGGTVTVTGNCQPNTVGFVLSPAFLHDATHEFAGVGAVNLTTDAAGNFTATATVPTSRAPGTYLVTARCGGGNLGLSARLTVTRGSLPFTGRPIAAMVVIGSGAVLLGAALIVAGLDPRRARRAA